MTLKEAIERDYEESNVVSFVRREYPDVPAEVWHCLFSSGYTMGSFYGFNEARQTLEETMLEHAVAHLTKCIQCGSKWCGPIVCRFYSVRHDKYLKQWNDGAAQVKREFESRPDHDMRPDGMPLKPGT